MRWAPSPVNFTTKGGGVPGSRRQLRRRRNKLAHPPARSGYSDSPLVLPRARYARAARVSPSAPAAAASPRARERTSKQQIFHLLVVYLSDLMPPTLVGHRRQLWHYWGVGGGLLPRREYEAGSGALASGMTLALTEVDHRCRGVRRKTDLTARHFRSYQFLQLI
jgi:hypothetical protein